MISQKDFEMNACVDFMVDGYEFSIRQSRANPDGTWYLYKNEFPNEDTSLGVISNPFKKNSDFLFEASILVTAWKKRNNK